MTFQQFQLVGRLVVTALVAIMAGSSHPDYAPAFTFYCLLVQLLLLLGYHKHQSRH